MTRELLRDLLLRQLGLKHKLKVHDSVKQPETHEDMAANLLARWEMEDEVAAIDEIVGNLRRAKVSEKRALLEKDLSVGKVKKKASKG